MNYGGCLRWKLQFLEEKPSETEKTQFSLMKDEEVKTLERLTAAV